MLDIQAGKVVGKVDFGGGADVLSLTGGSSFRGTLVNSGGRGGDRRRRLDARRRKTSAPSTSPR